MVRVRSSETQFSNQSNGQHSAQSNPWPLPPLENGDHRYVYYVEQPADLVTQCSFSRRRKVPSALAASIPLNAVWIRPANLRTIPFGKACHFGDYVGYAGGMTAQST
jgi:hypothetical protein